MNWLAFLLLTWLMMGLDLGLSGLLVLGKGEIHPRFAIVLLVFVCLHAPPGALMLGAILIGLLMDVVVTVPEVQAESSLVIIGPYALGCMLAAYAILTVRSVMHRKSPITLATLALLATLLIEVVRLTLLTARSFYDDIELVSGASSLGNSLGVAVYTAVVALLLAPVLGALRRPLRFHPSSSMGFVIHS